MLIAKLLAISDVCANPNDFGCLGGLLKLNPEKGTIVGDKYSQLSIFISLFVRLAFVFSGVFLLLLLIGGGFSIIASGGNAKGVENGKNAITGAIVGFLVVFAAYWIIQIIQAVTGVPIFTTTQ